MMIGQIPPKRYSPSFSTVQSSTAIADSFLVVTSLPALISNIFPELHSSFCSDFLLYRTQKIVVGELQDYEPMLVYIRSPLIIN
ncbi:hypothetical protein O6P43_009598 [Quillaja saponaria]|uniref:Uncharacterized protein n=1 Tax=Quillaja saponaria TaxID=32244 RepID=A0AAD7VDD5_QUISA|nr:hypothetical protein O6P43_009598 [Quillaja saponaria]